MTPNYTNPSIETTSVETSMGLVAAGYGKPRVLWYWAVKPNTGLAVKLSGFSERLENLSLVLKWQIYPAWQFGELLPLLDTKRGLSLVDIAFSLSGAYDTVKKVGQNDFSPNKADALGRIMITATYQGIPVPDRQHSLVAEVV